MGFAAKVRGFMGYPEEEYDEQEYMDDAQSTEESPEESPSGELVLAKPERFEEASAIADHLAANRLVLLNLQDTPHDAARRLIDFLGGAAYARDGLFKRVAVNVYLITPFYVDFIDQQEEMSASAFGML